MILPVLCSAFTLSPTSKISNPRVRILTTSPLIPSISILSSSSNGFFIFMYNPAKKSNIISFTEIVIPADKKLIIVTNPDILHAIRVHTTGVPDMNLLDKILFISDYIEPNRDKAPHLKELRKIAEQNLDLTTYHILKDTVEYLKKHEDQTMDPTTLAAYDYYKNWFENQNTNQKGIGE